MSEGLFYAWGTFIKALEFLVAESHVVEKNKEMKLISLAEIEIYYIHNSICLLK